MEHPIVVGVGDLDRDRGALHWAADEAAHRGAGLRLIHVWGQAPHSGWAAQALVSYRVGALPARDVIRRAVCEVRERVPDLEVTGTCVLGSGRPAGVLLRTAHDAQLLVIGGHAHRRADLALLPSTAHALAARTVCPLIVAGPDPGVERVEPAGLVVVGIDEHATEAAITFAFDYASRHGAAVRAVHAFSFQDAVGEVDRDTGSAETSYEAHSRLLAEALAGWGEKYPDVAISYGPYHGGAPETLAVLSSGADLLVLGARRGSRRQPVLGPVTRTMLAGAHCPVAVVPQTGVGDR